MKKLCSLESAAKKAKVLLISNKIITHFFQLLANDCTFLKSTVGKKNVVVIVNL